MSELKTPRYMPYGVRLALGEYMWCACGRTKDQPFCDNSHQDTGCTPVQFAITEENQEVWLCGCKRTGNPPYCDGSHQFCQGS
jgi:CDGSH-type Zn-finger protein